jgi:hypothetical protein
VVSACTHTIAYTNEYGSSAAAPVSFVNPMTQKPKAFDDYVGLTHARPNIHVVSKDHVETFTSE